jgi:hypothetical protein
MTFEVDGAIDLCMRMAVACGFYSTYIQNGVFIMAVSSEKVARVEERSRLFRENLHPNTQAAYLNKLRATLMEGIRRNR